LLCPYCYKEIHFEPEEELELPLEDNTKGIKIAAGYCPACNKLIIYLYEGKGRYTVEGVYYADDFTNELLLYPRTITGIFLAEEVPEQYQKDYYEALKVLPISPKASAALSRRCLQRLFHSQLGIKKKGLAEEILEYLATQNAPSYIASSIDAIRNIGNFAAHPLKDTNTGEIIDVEPGEAEWLLSVLEMLFDFHFIQPSIVKAKKDELNKKLASYGKPPMK
jgi:hypothetical protein